MASKKMTAMRNAMTPEETKTKGLKPWQSGEWMRRKAATASKEARRMEEGAARREAKKNERAERHAELLKSHQAA